MDDEDTGKTNIYNILIYTSKKKIIYNIQVLVI